MLFSLGNLIYPTNIESIIFHTTDEKSILNLLIAALRVACGNGLKYCNVIVLVRKLLNVGVVKKKIIHWQSERSLLIGSGNNRHGRTQRSLINYIHLKKVYIFLD